MDSRIRVLTGLNRLAFMAMCLAVGFLVVATAIPQHRNMVALESALDEARSREKDTLADKEYHAVEYHALRTDPAFLELHARDRLDYHRPGERVLKVRRAP